MSPGPYVINLKGGDQGGKKGGQVQLLRKCSVNYGPFSVTCPLVLYPTSSRRNVATPY